MLILVLKKLLCLTVSVILLIFSTQTEGDSSVSTIGVHPLTLCADAIKLSLYLQNVPVSPLQCSELLFPLFSKHGIVTKMFITGQNTTVWLRNLDKNTTYVFQVTCETGYASDEEHLITTLGECETVPSPTVVAVSSGIPSVKSVHISQSVDTMTATATEIAYTVCLSFVGVIVVLIPVYFVWKRHRRRQRIRRIFGHVSTDPFENLHDHMEIEESPTAV